jgi:hypothetical protein
MKDFLETKMSSIENNLAFKDFKKVTHTDLSQEIFFIDNEFQKFFKNLKDDISDDLKFKDDFQSILNEIKDEENKLLAQGLEKRELKKDNSYFICNLNNEKKKHGEGILNIKNCIIFQGLFENDEFKKGILIKKTEDNSVFEIFRGKYSNAPDTIIFEGFFYPHIHKDCSHENNMTLIKGKMINNNFINGEIIYTNQKGEITQVVIGKLIDNKKYGECIILDYSKETLFFGNFKENKPEGNCFSWKKDSHLLTSTYTNGISTEGKCLYLKDKTGIYSGDIQINQNSGENIYSFSDKSKGQIVYSNNDIYIGTFKNGLRSGLNNEYFIREPNSKIIKFVIEGKFEEDLIKNEVKVFLRTEQGETKLVYQGKFDNNHHFIEGEYLYICGDKYSGKFKDSLKEGEGVYTFKNNSQIKGVWQKDLMQGGFEFSYTKMGRNLTKNYTYADGKQVIDKLEY